MKVLYCPANLGKPFADLKQKNRVGYQVKRVLQQNLSSELRRLLVSSDSTTIRFKRNGINR